MTFPLVLDLAADGIPVAVTCGLLGFSRQAFYSWKADPVSERDLVDAYATNAAFEVHRDDPGFGYRFIADELAEAGHAISERRVWRICSQAGIVSAHARKRGRWKKPGPPVHDDLVERDFTATGPNRLWLTDITEHPTGEGKLYLCAVKDVWSRRIVGYAIDSRMTSHLAVDALEMAITRRGRDQVAGCVVHADRGSQFRSRPYVAALHRHRTARLDGPGRFLRGQRRHGVLLRPAPEERPEHPPLGHPRPAAPGHRDLDRTHLPPPASATSPRPAHPGRV